ncbi:DUF732 domain-containing protein [[Mycobacterium] kokjensenii]|uniref:DUF732 domain-containing protein n=1 Tax=[Mycobacterium] kokjensenii TaxID=3064287 RepID=A0ABM9L6P6_9MYCO|nr:DUF732 domain-containing protein [Mycolicibacter sp. MU0083]CAJ1493309.1 DUF732 domain-containing protein [Mycolicibacter sp. MU0083]
MRHFRWFVAAAGAAGLLCLAAPASAGPDPDGAFIGAIDQAGIEYTQPQDAVAVGREVCDYLHAGHSRDAAARAVRISNRSLSVKNSARFVAFSEAAFCPDESDH